MGGLNSHVPTICLRQAQILNHLLFLCTDVQVLAIFCLLRCIAASFWFLFLSGVHLSPSFLTPHPSAQVVHTYVRSRSPSSRPSIRMNPGQSSKMYVFWFASTRDVGEKSTGTRLAHTLFFCHAHVY
ncbi:hypothetical protein CCHR01_09551 [Colletotrichum chrysophilum]|uniref:Uncharacterized protein n=1 Tax=Colletotrichum chrysophilum TaxID=1836956 RepID=A0AAD9AGL3_9PEZI|nr:hypothetical protein CCHR01_09551 [Colletotrichum chrysophilum]